MHPSLPRAAWWLSLALTASLGGVGCSTTEIPATVPASQVRTQNVCPNPAGVWRAVLHSPGGELGFALTIAQMEGKYVATAHNHDERVAFTSVTVAEGELRLRIDGYDSEIVASIAADGNSMSGEWSKTAPEGTSRLPFTATRGEAPRLECPAQSELSAASVHGAWSMTFTEDDGSTFAGRAELVHRAASTQLTGTIITNTGDYRYLEGCYNGGTLALSVFDGAHAFLFRASTNADGSLTGHFWSRDTYHARWTANPAVAEQPDNLADPSALVRLTNTEGQFRFAFPDLDGRPVSSEDARFRGKVLVVDIFGSWCPNCNDQAPVLARWHREHGARGLEIVGLAYEFTGDARRDAEYVRKFATRHGIGFPLLVAGMSDKAEATKTVPDLSRVAAYPTTIFIGRDGKVRQIYSGYYGPATGQRHLEMLAEQEALLERLLAEPKPDPPLALSASSCSSSRLRLWSHSARADE